MKVFQAGVECCPSRGSSKDLCKRVQNSETVVITWSAVLAAQAKEEKAKDIVLGARQRPYFELDCRIYSYDSAAFERIQFTQTSSRH